MEPLTDRRGDCYRRSVFPLLPILIFVVLIGGYYFLISRPPSRRDGTALVLAVVGALPLVDGGVLLTREYGRWQNGRVGPGVVVGKLSSTGEAGSQTIGGRRRWRRSRRLPSILTRTGFRLDDELARLMLTGSTNAWVVDYRYPCDTTSGCRQREFVSHDLWSNLHVGRTVNVRTAKDEDQGRLDENALQSTAIAKVAMGGTLLLAAGFVSGRVTLRRRRKYITAPAVVTAVDPVTHGDEVRWRVRFAYFGADGTACESADQVSIKGLKPGDDCIAVYPPEHPDLGTLRLIPPA